MNKPLLYTRVSENSRAHYASSSFWTCPFSDRAQCRQRQTGHRNCRSVYCIHSNVSVLYFTSPSNNVEQTCNKAIKICAVELTPRLWTVNNYASRKCSNGRVMQYVPHKSAMPHGTTEHFSTILLSPHTHHHNYYIVRLLFATVRLISLTTAGALRSFHPSVVTQRHSCAELNGQAHCPQCIGISSGVTAWFPASNRCKWR